MSSVLQPPVQCGIRSVSESDIPEIMAIETASYQYPWSEGIIKDCFKSGYFFYCWNDHQKIAGYGVLSCAANEAHILNLCVSPDRRGEGIGQSLLDHLLSTARRQNVDTVFLEVRHSNSAAIRLYENNGFNQIGMRRDYYPAQDGREDALVFARTLFI